MISLDEAHAIISTAVRPLGKERLPLAGAAERTLAEPVVATVESPRADVSMMDGYAIGEDAFVGSVFEVIGLSAAGRSFAGSIAAGQAVRIFTGAALPKGADRVIIQENVLLDGKRMTVIEAPGGAIFVRRRGSDFAVGDVVVAAGTRLIPGALVAAAGTGARSVEVARRPRVVTIATGDELRPVGASLDDPDTNIDSIAPGLHAMLGAMGAEILDHHLLGDDLAALEAAAAEAVTRADLIVVTGGASVGERDHAKAMFAPLGMELLFSKVAIKPGKPVWLGRVGATLVMGLPGNPGSALVTARLLLAPLVSGLLGEDAPLHWLELPLAVPIPTTGARETFLRATLIDGQLHPVANQDSGAQSALAQARWLVRCPAGQGPLDTGAFVSALAF